MKVNAIIQARCGSSRFPNKVFALIEGKPLIWHVVNRLKYAETINDIIVATTDNPLDDKIEEWCKANHAKYFRGSEDDVLNRYYSASQKFPSDYIVRITADDPFKEPAIIDRVVKTLVGEKLDYVTNNFPPSFPEGLDCEAFTHETLEKMELNATEDVEREHVTQYIFRHLNEFRIKNISSGRMLKHYRWTIDTELDYKFVLAIYAKREVKNKPLFMDEIISILEKNPSLLDINSSVKRSLMYKN